MRKKNLVYNRVKIPFLDSYLFAPNSGSMVGSQFLRLQPGLTESRTISLRSARIIRQRVNTAPENKPLSVADSMILFNESQVRVPKRIRMTPVFIGRTHFAYALVRPFLYFDHFHIFDLFCTATSLLRPLYFDSRTSTFFTSNSLLRLAYICTSTFCQIWTYYWSRSTGPSKVLVEVNFGQKSRSKV